MKRDAQAASHFQHAPDSATHSAPNSEPRDVPSLSVHLLQFHCLLPRAMYRVREVGRVSSVECKVRCAAAGLGCDTVSRHFPRSAQSHFFPVILLRAIGFLDDFEAREEGKIAQACAIWR